MKEGLTKLSSSEASFTDIPQEGIIVDGRGNVKIDAYHANEQEFESASSLVKSMDRVALAHTGSPMFESSADRKEYIEYIIDLNRWADINHPEIRDR